MAPTIDASGTLRFLGAGQLGTALVTVRLRDNGGTAGGGSDTSAAQTFEIRFTDQALPSGTLDPTFDADGVLTLNSGPGSVNNVRSIVLDDGRILVAATLDESGSSRYGVWRLLADGSLDQTFGAGGIAVGSSPAGRLPASSAAATANWCCSTVKAIASSD